MDLADPAVDFLALGRSMGVPGVRIEDAHEIDGAVKDAFEQGGTNLIEILIAPSNGG